MTPRDLNEARDDSRKSYEVAIAAIREREIRAGNYKPLPSRPHEIQWANEGPKP